MEIEELSDELKQFVQGLKYAASTIENDIYDALEMAKDEEDFLHTALEFMRNLSFEVLDVMSSIDSMIDDRKDVELRQYE